MLKGFKFIGFGAHGTRGSGFFLAGRARLTGLSSCFLASQVSGSMSGKCRGFVSVCKS